MHLERFYTGEADAIATLRDAGVEVSLDDGWAHRVSFPNNGSLTIDNLALLKKFSKLDSLQLVSATLTTDHFKIIGQLSSVHHLTLTRSDLNEADLAHLSDLDLYGLWLSDTRVGDAGLIHLQKMSHLYNLWLKNTNVTDAGLVALHPIKSLEWVIVNETKVTEDGERRLREALPKIERTRN